MPDDIERIARAVLDHRKHCPTCLHGRACLPQDALLNRWARAWLDIEEARREERQRLDEIAQLCREALKDLERETA